MIAEPRKPCNSFFMVNMANGMNRGRVRPTTTTTHNMAALLQHILSPGLQRTNLTFDIHVVVKQGIRWPVSRDHIAGSSL